MDSTGPECGSASGGDLGGMARLGHGSCRSLFTALPRHEEDSLPTNTNSAPAGNVKSRELLLLVIAPACSLLLVALLYLLLGPLIPERLAIHVGPDGVGYGSSLLMVGGACIIAAAVFAIGAATTKEFLKNNHWFQTQKSIAVSTMALGYGVVGVAVATILSTLAVAPNSVAGNSVGMGLLGFLLMFIAAACTYVAVLPRAGIEPASSTYPSN